MSTFWTQGGLILVNGSGEPITCAICPCDVVPCSCGANASITSLTVTMSAKKWFSTDGLVWDSPPLAVWTDVVFVMSEDSDCLWTPSDGSELDDSGSVETIDITSIYLETGSSPDCWWEALVNVASSGAVTVIKDTGSNPYGIYLQTPAFGAPTSALSVGYEITSFVVSV